MDQRGRIQRGTKQYDVTIPAGTFPGSQIRLRGQGGKGHTGGTTGDLYLRVRISPHPVFRLKGHDLEMNLQLAPWEAALGAKVPIKTLDGNVLLTIPPGTQSGHRLRLRGKGLQQSGRKDRGDAFAVIQIRVPEKMTARERELFESLARESTFNART